MKNFVGANIRRLRESMNMKQVHLAQLCGWAACRLNHYECGNRKPSIQEIMTIAKTLRIPVTRLLETQEEE